jgi:hypothetical protein
MRPHFQPIDAEAEAKSVEVRFSSPFEGRDVSILNGELEESTSSGVERHDRWDPVVRLIKSVRKGHFSGHGRGKVVTKGIRTDIGEVDGGGDISVAAREGIADGGTGESIHGDTLDIRQGIGDGSLPWDEDIGPSGKRSGQDNEDSYG